MLPPAEVAYRERWCRDAVDTADAIQCLSEFVRGQVLRHFGADPERAFVTYCALAAPAMPGAKIAAAQRPYFLYPANDWPHKNHEGLLRAYALYRRDAGPAAWDLLLTGHHGRPEALAARIRELGLEGCCRLAGHVPAAEYDALLRGAGALFFPSLYEGFGIPVLEAMAAGVPVACSRAASLPEVAGKAALPFDPADPEAIARALATLGSDEALRRRLTAAGLRRARDFTTAREAGRLADRLAMAARGAARQSHYGQGPAGVAG